MNVFELVGKTITAFDNHAEWPTFTTADGKRYAFDHWQDCCEHVRHISTFEVGDSIIGQPITLAEDHHPEDPSWWESGYSNDSHTWTHVVLRTATGGIDIWFLGESNGYYGESVELNEIV